MNAAKCGHGSAPPSRQTGATIAIIPATDRNKWEFIPSRQVAPYVTNHTDFRDECVRDGYGWATGHKCAWSGNMHTGVYKLRCRARQKQPVNTATLTIYTFTAWKVWFRNYYVAFVVCIKKSTMKNWVLMLSRFILVLHLGLDAVCIAGLHTGNLSSYHYDSTSAYFHCIRHIWASGLDKLWRTKTNR